jgi:hypothetical protein
MYARLLTRVGTCKEVFANVAAGIDSKVNARVAAHISSLICVSLRMAASAEAPSAPMLLSPRLQRDGWGHSIREQAGANGLTLTRALTQKQTLAGAGSSARVLLE